MQRRKPSVVAALAGVLALAGCTPGPKYRQPAAVVPPAFKEQPPADFKEAQGWKQAQPLLEERRGLLAECMKRLPAADREVVERCYGSQTTLAVVAAQLGRPLNTVKSILKRARRALYDCIRRGVDKEDRR